ncbi:unnamed protein product [Alternaria alternata]
MQSSAPFADVEKRGSNSSQGSGDAVIDIDIDIGSLQDYSTGYPLQAAFQSSESSWSIYRGFSYLHARVILDLQDELRCLEEDLEEIDLENEGENRLRSRKDDLKYAKEKGVVSPRACILDNIRSKLISYDEVLLKARELNAFQRPSKRDYRSFRTWFWNKKPLSYELEEQFIKRKEDLVSLRHGREWSGFMASSSRASRECIVASSRIFAAKELREKTNDEHVHYYSQSRIEKLVGLFITLIIFILLVLPVVAMYKLTSVGDRNSTFDAVGLLVVFTLLFSAA